MKKKYSDLLNLVQIINFVLPKDGNTEWTKAQKKLSKIGERLKPYIDEFNDKRADILLDNALEIDGKLQLKADGSYEYNKEGVKKRDKDMSNLINSEFDYTPIQIINPEGLDDYLFLNGWVEGVEFKNVEQEEEIEL